MKNKSLKFILFLLLGLASIAYIVDFFYYTVKKLSDYNIKLEKKVPEDYIELFNHQFQKDLVLQSTVSFNYRNTIADFIYKNEYDIRLTRISVKPDFNIEQNIIESHEKAKGVPPQIKSSYNSNNFRIDYNGKSKDTVSKIYLTLNTGEHYIYHKNDSIAYYYLSLKKGYLQYKQEGIYEISIEAKKQFYLFNLEKPIVIIFLKKKGFIYFMTIQNKDDNASISQDILYNFLNTSL